MNGLVIGIVLAVIVLAFGYFVVYRRQVKNDQLLDALRTASIEQLQAWPDSDLRSAQAILNNRLAPQRIAAMPEEKQVRLGYQLGRVNELLKQREAERIQGYIEDEEQRQNRHFGGSQ